MMILLIFLVGVHNTEYEVEKLNAIGSIPTSLSNEKLNQEKETNASSLSVPADILRRQSDFLRRKSTLSVATGVATTTPETTVVAPRKLEVSRDLSYLYYFTL